jgi:hypothetical protein
MLAMEIFRYSPYILPAILHCSARDIVVFAVFEMTNLAIAYGLLRRSEVVRVLWSLWTVGCFLSVLALAVAEFASSQYSAAWPLISEFYMLVAVGFLYSPAARDFFRINTAPSKQLDSTPVEAGTPYEVPSKPTTGKLLAYASIFCYLCVFMVVLLTYWNLGKLGIAAVFVMRQVLTIAAIPAGVLALIGFALAIISISKKNCGKESYIALGMPIIVYQTLSLLGILVQIIQQYSRTRH